MWQPHIMHQDSVQRKSCPIVGASGFCSQAIFTDFCSYCATGKCCFLGKFKLQKDCNQSCLSKRILGLVEMTCGLVHTRYSLHEWQAVKLTFFAPCKVTTTWLAHLGEWRSAEREVAGSNPCWTNPQGLLFVCFLFCKINYTMLMILECVLCYTF